MAYLKPAAVTTKLFNPLAMKFGIGGSQTLVVARRRSGGEQRVPVIPLEWNGARYLISTRGESEWVKNIRAAGKGTLQGKQGTNPFIVMEVPVHERGPVLDAYKKVAGKTVEGYFKSLPDPADHPVFKLS